MSDNLLYLPCGVDETVKILTVDGKLISSHKMVRPYTVFKYRENIYCISEKGLYEMNDGVFKLLIPYYFPISYAFVKTASDIDGNLIISNMKEVFRFKNNRLEKIFDNANLVIDICVDREGNLWLATYQGVYNLFKQQFKNYLLQDKKDMFRVIVGDPGGDGFLTGTFDGKLISMTSSGNKELKYPYNPNGYFFENYCAKVSDAVYIPAAGL